MTKKSNQAPMVKEITPETMMGSTPLEKALNAYITRNFIGSRNLPSDECLSEAREIISQNMAVKQIANYLIGRFDPLNRINVREEAIEIRAMMCKDWWERSG